MSDDDFREVIFLGFEIRRLMKYDLEKATTMDRQRISLEDLRLAEKKC